MSQTDHYKAPNEYPLTFVRHTFDAYCFNAIGCRVIYDNHDFSPYVRGGGDPGTYRAPPPKPGYRDRLRASYIVPTGPGFPGPVQVHWKSLDGVPHEARLDMDQIFPGRRVLHSVPVADYAEHPFSGKVAIILEVNDRTLTIYQEATIVTKSEQVPGNKHSHHRTELIQVWSRVY